MVIQNKESHLNKCLVSSTSSAVISDGTYTFRNLLREIQSLNFVFQIKATGSSCSQLHPSVLLRTDSILPLNTGTTTIEGDMIRIVGDIDQSFTLGNEMLLSIPSSESCVFELVQASLTLQLPTSERLVEYCQIGHQLNIDWEKSVAVDFLSAETRNVALEDFVLEFHPIPKSLAGISLFDGIWNYIAWNYEDTWKGLSKEEQKNYKYSYSIFHSVYKRIEHFITGDINMTERSNVERVVGAACEHLNSFITNPTHKVDSQKVSIRVFNVRWQKYRPTFQMDRSKLPTSIEFLTLIDAIQNYVVYDYKTKYETLSREKKKKFNSSYRKIRSSFLQILPYQVGNLSKRKDIEATVQAALFDLLPNAQASYKTITVSVFEFKTRPSVSRKRLRNQE